jgi:hypothetical protein
LRSNLFEKSDGSSRFAGVRQANREIVLYTEIAATLQLQTASAPRDPANLR